MGDPDGWLSGEWKVGIHDLFGLGSGGAGYHCLPLRAVLLKYTPNLEVDAVAP